MPPVRATTLAPVLATSPAEMMKLWIFLSL
jgi:hypothetical protein